MSFKVMEEILDRDRYLGPETCVRADLVSMSVEAAVVQVKDPRSEACEMYLGNAS